MGNCCRRRRPKRDETGEEPEEDIGDDERDEYRYSIGHPEYVEYLEHLHAEEPWNEE